MLRVSVEKWINERIDQKLKKSTSEIRSFMKNHERKNLFINNMLKEINKAEKKIVRKTGKMLLLDKERLKNLTYQMTDVFIKHAINIKLNSVIKNYIPSEENRIFEKPVPGEMDEAENKLELAEMGVIEVERNGVDQ
jgi:hypothetical protein